MEKQIELNKNGGGHFMSSLAKKIGFIGGGRMAEAIFSGLIASGATSASNIFVIDISKPRLEDISARYGVAIAENDPVANSTVAALTKECDIIFISVKPQFAPEVLVALGEAVTGRHLVISIVGGMSLATLEASIKVPVIRVMPNIPMAVRAGVAGIAIGSRCTEEHSSIAVEIFERLGQAFIVPETMIDPLTGISGCGPAYSFMFIEALADGGVKCGLPRDLAYLLAAQTLLGSARMVLDLGLHPGKLKDDVCSPGGSTIEGVYSLEKSAFRGSVIEAVEAGVKRSAAIGSTQPVRPMHHPPETQMHDIGLDPLDMMGEAPNRI